jgi:hypothetical protein
MDRGVAAVALGASAFGVLALAGPSTANTDHEGAYRQGTDRFHCTGQVEGDGNGGRIYVQVRGREVRPEDGHFRTAALRTRLIAEEKTYDGSWKPVERTKPYRGRLGAAWDNGRVNVSPFRWYVKRPNDSEATPLPLPMPVPLPVPGDDEPRRTDRSPVLKVRVAGQDDVFRARVVTRAFDDEGALLARLVTREGTCRL